MLLAIGRIAIIMTVNPTAEFNDVKINIDAIILVLSSSSFLIMPIKSFNDLKKTCKFIV